MQIGIFLRGYSLYSTYTCLKAVINSEYESLFAVIILTISLTVSIALTGFPDTDTTFDQLNSILLL
jgi:hypothetical protein